MFDAAKKGVTKAGKVIATGTTAVVEKTKSAATSVWEGGKSIKVLIAFTKNRIARK